MRNVGFTQGGTGRLPFGGDPDALPLETVCALAKARGFQFVESYGRGKNYTVNLRRRQITYVEENR
jgi:hypothetical protein